MLTLEEKRARNRRYQNKWYAANPANRKKNTDRGLARKRKLREWFDSLKSRKRCSCGEDRLAALDFHHRDDESKIIEISNALKRGWSQERILAEIAKCDVLCANCHRVLHAKTRSSMVRASV